MVKRIKMMIMFLIMMIPVGVYATDGLLYGDVNLDGQVTVEDSTYLSKYLAEWTGYTLSGVALINADVNLDGSITSLDNIILSRYLNSWKGYEALPYILPKYDDVELIEDQYQVILKETAGSYTSPVVMRGDIINLDPTIQIVSGSAAVSFKVTIKDKNGSAASEDVVDLVKSFLYFGDDLVKYNDEDSHEVYTKAQLLNMNQISDSFELEQDGNVLIYHYNHLMKKGDNVTLFNSLVIPYDLTDEEIKKISNFQLLIEPMAIYDETLINVPNTGLTIIFSIVIGIGLILCGVGLFIMSNKDLVKSLLVVFGLLLVSSYSIIKADDVQTDNYILNRIIVKDTNFINASDYDGVICDGVNDDTEGLKEAIADLNAQGGVLKLPYDKQCVVKYKLPYNASVTEKILELSSDKKTVLDLNDSSINLYDGRNIRDDLIYGYQIVYVTGNSDEVTIKNGELVGDRKTHIYSTDSTKTQEWGHGIYVGSNLADVVIENMNIHDMIGDGIYLRGDVNSGLITVKNSEISYNRRQGISIIDGSNFDLDSLYIHNIGDFDGIAGANPKDGIDIEPFQCDTKIESIYIHNTKIENNTNYAIEASVASDGGYDKVKELKIENSSLDGALLDSDRYVNLILNNDKFYSTRNVSIDEAAVDKTDFYADTNHGIDLFNSSVNDSRFLSLNNEKGLVSGLVGSTLKNTNFNNVEVIIYKNSDGYPGMNVEDSNNITFTNCKVNVSIASPSYTSYLYNSKIINSEFLVARSFIGANLNFENSRVTYSNKNLSREFIGPYDSNGDGVIDGYYDGGGRVDFKCESCNFFNTSNELYNNFVSILEYNSIELTENHLGCWDDITTTDNGVNHFLKGTHILNGNYDSMVCVYRVYYGGNQYMNCHEDSSLTTCPAT